MPPLSHCQSWFLRKKLTSKSRIQTCLYIGLCSLFLQVCIFICLLLCLEEEEIKWPLFSRLKENYRLMGYVDDIQSVSQISTQLGITLIALDKHVLLSEKVLKSGITADCIYCKVTDPVVLGIEQSTYGEKSMEFLEILKKANFATAILYNFKPVEVVAELDRVHTAVFAQRSVTFQIVILHTREDNMWWFGSVLSDVLAQNKLMRLGISITDLKIMNTEGAIERFELVKSVTQHNSALMFPRDISKVIQELETSQFIECNATRADVFHKKFFRDESDAALRFRHRAWKLLSRAKSVLDSLAIPFWLSSGTCLGYYRECGIIAHSKDVDIGIWAKDYSPHIVSEFQNHGLSLKIWLGRPNDSLEISFVDQAGTKLDIFFFYEEGNKTVWNGGTQVKSGKKFKYTFPKFTLCWTLFRDLKVRIPCETNAYIVANYGNNWFTPVVSWDWKSSPPNVQPNGMWKTSELSEVIKLYP